MYFYKILFIAKSFSISFSIKVLIDFVSSFSKSNEKVDQQCSRCTIFLNSFLINHSIFKGYVDFLCQGHKYYIVGISNKRTQFLILFLFLFFDFQCIWSWISDKIRNSEHGFGWLPSKTNSFMWSNLKNWISVKAYI